MNDKELIDNDNTDDCWDLGTNVFDNDNTDDCWDFGTSIDDLNEIDLNSGWDLGTFVGSWEQIKVPSIDIDIL